MKDRDELEKEAMEAFNQAAALLLEALDRATERAPDHIRPRKETLRFMEMLRRRLNNNESDAETSGTGALGAIVSKGSGVTLHGPFGWKQNPFGMAKPVNHEALIYATQAFTHAGVLLEHAGGRLHQEDPEFASRARGIKRNSEKAMDILVGGGAVRGWGNVPLWRALRRSFWGHTDR